MLGNNRRPCIAYTMYFNIKLDSCLTMKIPNDKETKAELCSFRIARTFWVLNSCNNLILYKNISLLEKKKLSAILYNR